MNNTQPLAEHSVIQIGTDPAVRSEFHGHLAVVDEVKSWGVQAYVRTFEGRAYVRLQHGTFVKIGDLEFIPIEDDDDNDL